MSLPIVTVGKGESAVQIAKTAVLAPMASIADTAYRRICKEQGAAYVVGELASAKGISYGDENSRVLLKVRDYERPMGVQLFGSEPEFMVKAAKIAMEYSPEIIDLNMGCPVPKVVGNGAGSALMKTPELAYEITKAVAENVPVPVTVKFRSGWNEESINAVEFACLMEKAGAAMVTVHGRTKNQMYRPPVDLDIIKQVKAAVSIPVCGNGGIDSIDSYLHMMEYTGCDLAMIGQASYGNPWIFRDIRHYLETGERLPAPSLEEKLDTLSRHVHLVCEYVGEYAGMKISRRQASFYLKGLHGAPAFRKACGELSTLEDLEKLIALVKQYNPRG